MKARKEIEEAFEEFVRIGFPNVTKGSPQYLAIYRVFIAGAFTMVDLVSRPYESPEEAEAYAQELMQLAQGIIAEMRTEDFKLRAGKETTLTG